MNGIERMQAYIDRTKGGFENYELGGLEIAEVIEAYYSSPFHCVSFAFRYGRAKGYRAAKAEQRKKKGGSTWEKLNFGRMI